MGLNIDNLFVRENADTVIAAFLAAADDPKCKFSVADIGGGWTQLIDSHCESPPPIAAKLSSALNTRVVCAQVYEVSGDAALHVFDAGRLVEGWADDSAEDPQSKVEAAIENLGITAQLLMFRETVRRGGWIMATKR